MYLAVMFCGVSANLSAMACNKLSNPFSMDSHTRRKSSIWQNCLRACSGNSVSTIFVNSFLISDVAGKESVFT